MIACVKYREQIAKSLGLEVMRAGRHSIINSKGIKIGERWIESIWYCVINVGCDDSGIISVIDLRKSNHYLISFSRLMDGTLVDSVSAQIPSHIVMPDFDSIKLRTLCCAFRLDGVAYSIGIESIALRAFIEFENPVDERLVIVENGIISVMQVLGDTTSKSVLHDFIRAVKMVVEERSKS
jgi:hypothetical protein